MDVVPLGEPTSPPTITYPRRLLERRVRFRALIAGSRGPPRRSGRRRATYRPMEWVASLCTQLPRNPLLGNRASDYRNSRKLSFRQTGFSEIQLLSCVAYRLRST